MKLNLLPTHVSKEKQTRSAAVVSILIAVVAIGASFVLVTKSRSNLDEERADLPQLESAAAKARNVAASADIVITRAAILIRNARLAQAMKEHNRKYPELYDRVTNHTPSFFRISRIAAEPSANGTVVTMTGTIQTYQQYADLMLALMRIPNALSVSRSGFNVIDPYIPELTEVDQRGKPRRPGQDPIPDDPLQRYEQMQQSATTTGFTGEGGFGTADNSEARRAMPGWSEVTVSIVLSDNLRTPNPRATLAANGSASPAGGGSSTPGTGGGNFPAIPGGSGGPPAGPGGAGRGPGITPAGGTR